MGNKSPKAEQDKVFFVQKKQQPTELQKPTPQNNPNPIKVQQNENKYPNLDENQKKQNEQNPPQEDDDNYQKKKKKQKKNEIPSDPPTESDDDYDPSKIRKILQKSPKQPSLGNQPNKKVYLLVNHFLKKLLINGKFDPSDIKTFSDQIGDLNNQIHLNQLVQITKSINHNQDQIQTKTHIQKFKQMCSPLKIKVINQFINSISKLNYRRVAFVFGASSEEIYFFCDKFLQIGHLKRKSEIENNRPQIECFDYIEQENQIIYPFPIYSNQQEPLELKLFYEYSIKDMLNKCNEYGVIVLISNIDDKSAYRTLNLMGKCFKGNLEQVLQKLAIYHFKLDKEKVKKKVQSYKEINKLKNNIQYFQSRAKALNRLRYIQKAENDKYIADMDNQIYEIIQSEISLLTIKVIKSFEKRKYEEFVENVKLLEDYRKFKSNAVKKLKNKDIDQMNTQLNNNFNSIKAVFKQKFQQLLETKTIEPNKMEQIQNQISFLKKISEMKLKQFQDMVKKAKSYYFDILADSNKLARNAIETGLKNLKDCQVHQRASIKNLLENKAKLFDDMFSDKNSNEKFLDKIINQKIENVGKLKGSDLKKAQQELKIIGDGHKNQQKIKRVINNVRQINYSREQKDLGGFLQRLNDLKNLKLAQANKDIQKWKRQYQIKLKHDEKCKDLYQKIIIKLQQIYNDYVKDVQNICEIKKPTNQDGKKCNELISKLQILEGMDIFRANENYKQKKAKFDELMGNAVEIQILEKINQSLDNLIKNSNIGTLSQIIQNIRNIEAKKSSLRAPKCFELIKQSEQKVNIAYEKFINMLIQIFNDPDPMSQQKTIIKYQNILIDLESTRYIQNREKFMQKYEKGKQKFYNDVKLKIKNEIQSIRIVENRDLENEAERKIFYEKIQKKIKDLISLIKENKILQEELGNQCAFVNKQAKHLHQQCKKIMNLDKISLKEKQIFQFNYQNLKSMKQYIDQPNVLVYIVYPSVQEIDRKLQKKIEDIKNQISLDNLNNLVVNLIELKIEQANFFHMKLIVKKSIDQIIAKYVKEKKDLGVLIQQLNASTEGVMILNDNPNFAEYIQIQNNKRRFRFGVDQVLAKIQFQNGNQDKSTLKTRFLNYEKKYNELVIQNNNSKREDNINKLVAEVKNRFQLKNYDSSKFKKSLNQLEQLLAYISAIWTLVHVRKLLSSSKNNNVSADALFKAHPAQVIAILRIFGFEPGYENNLVQILTGQGKSAILAFCSVIFALNGFQVNCACYSEYLSQRDFEDFLPLFKAFELDQRIFYGTFNKICSRILDENGQIRKLVGDLFINDKYVVSNKSLDMPKMLMIDEVDVFFSEQFYGKYYQPVFTLKDPSFKALADFMWNSKDNNNLWNSVKKSSQYNTFVKKFSNYNDLINQVVKQMIHALQTIQGAPKGYYDKKQDKIGYQQQDRIDYNVSYGYQTLFTYYKMRDEGEFNNSTVEKNAYFQISCGKYSYAQIPKKFTFTVGVTGTLKDLNKQTKRIIQDIYKINKFTYIPSVYGERNLRFYPDQDIKIFKQNQFHGRLKDMIMNKINIGRAVLVFFETSTKLLEFVKNPNNKLDNMNSYNEKANKYQKQKMVSQATRQKKITLLVRSYGRGTDFICRDKKVLANNGVHVIQTFLSEDISQETQIKGRTARQGDPGSYEMAILENQLQQFDITLAELQNNLGKKLYSFLHNKRNIKFDQKCRVINKQAEDSRIVHKSSQDFYQSLITKDINKVKKGLLEFNKGPQINIQKYRTAILLDVTGSMSGILQNTKSIIDKTIYEIKTILKQSKYHQDSVQIQFVCYRSYSSPWTQQLVYSSWQSKAQNLSKFLQNQRVAGGDGQEAIEVPLNFVYEQTSTLEINQVLLVGDAPPTPSNQVQTRRDKYNKEFWKNSKIGDYKIEAQNLANKGIKVYCFYLQDWARQGFEQIAAITQGKAKYMDPRAAIVNEDLKITVVEQVLSSISPDLVKKYRQVFIKHH